MKYNLAEELRFLQASGVEISVWSRPRRKLDTLKAELLKSLRTDRPFSPEEDGFLIETSIPTIQFFVAIKMPKDRNFRAVTITGNDQKSLNQMANLSPDEQFFETLKIIPLHQITDGPTTKPPDNGFRVVTTNGGIFRMFEVAIVTRITDKKSRHFLVVQETYRADLYRDEKSDRVSVDPNQYPGYDKWSSLKSLVQEMVEPSSLPTNIPQEKSIQSEAIPKDCKKVIFFNSIAGYGLVRSDDGSVGSVNWSQVVSKERFPILTTGQLVKVSGQFTGIKGTQYFGVSPLEG